MKKALKHPKADDAKRQCFQNKIKAYKAAGKPLIYLDESGFSNDMVRTHGYAAKGKRCYGLHDWGAKARTNVIGALWGANLLATCLFQCTIDSDVFHGWVMTQLLPNLPPGSVVIMDNASFHKRFDTQQAITEAGHILEYLPPYSPDLNPIEHKWAQAKSIRRKTGRSTEDIFKNEL